jgi:hypothetical protein
MSGSWGEGGNILMEVVESLVLGLVDALLKEETEGDGEALLLTFIILLSTIKDDMFERFAMTILEVDK